MSVCLWLEIPLGIPFLKQGNQASLDFETLFGLVVRNPSLVEEDKVSLSEFGEKTPTSKRSDAKAGEV